jgi:hypothetical protein
VVHKLYVVVPLYINEVVHKLYVVVPLYINEVVHKLYVVVPLQFSKIFILPATPINKVTGYRLDGSCSILYRKKYF